MVSSNQEIFCVIAKDEMVVMLEQYLRVVHDGRSVLSFGGERSTPCLRFYTHVTI